VLLALLGTTAAAARATTPGRNGPIVFRRFFDVFQTRGALFTVNANGTGVRQLTHPPRGALDTEPDWSPDGRNVVFERVFQGGRNLVYTVGRDGRGAKQLAPCGRGCSGQEGPIWSPDGSQIAFGSGGPRHEELWVARPDGSDLHRLTQPSRYDDQQPQWSPDGRRLVLVRIERARGRLALWVIRSDGGGARRITPWALGAGDHPDWSPDGRRILFRSNSRAPRPLQSNLYTVRPDGTGLRQVTHARGGKVQYLSSSYSPDGRWITFARTPGTGREGNADVYVMRADGTRLRNVTRSRAWESAPDWGPAASG
jgi:TolB protein